MSNGMADFVRLYALVCDDKSVRQALMDTPDEVLSEHGLALPKACSSSLSMTACMHPNACTSPSKVPVHCASEQTRRPSAERRRLPHDVIGTDHPLSRSGFEKRGS